MSKLRILAIADMHGRLPVITQEADIMFICGDISPFSIQFHKPAMQSWLLTTFTDWINSLNVEKVYMVAGNHDAIFQGMKHGAILELRQKTKFKLEYIKNELFNYIDNDGKLWSIFGTPYCSYYGTWPFMVPDDVLREKFEDIPYDVDFIISHDTPYGIGTQDVIIEKGDNEHIGNVPLREALDTRKFRWLFHGHIHGSNHEPDEFNGGQVVCVSMLNEECDLELYKPFYLEIEDDKR